MSDRTSDRTSEKTSDRTAESLSSYDRIYAVVRRIPEGKVATYGQVASLAGLAGHARQVGYALHALPYGSGVPWHRVINAQGRISPRSDPWYEDEQRERLAEEGVESGLDGRLPLARLRWQPAPVSERLHSIRPGAERCLIGILSALVASPAAAQLPRAEADAAFAFTDVHVLTMTSEGDPVSRNRTVLVRYGEIERIGPAAEVDVPVFYERIDGHGRLFLIPGLTDTHVHLRGRADRWMAMFIASGVTTVFNLAGGSRHLELRDLVRDGVVSGPTIYTSGPFTNLPRIKTPEDAEEAVREQAEAGYDFVKVHGNFDEAAYVRLNDAAREIGIPVIGHAPRNLPFAVVTENRIAMVAHAEELIYTDFRDLDTTRIAAVAQRMVDAGTWLTPTLSTFKNIVELWGDSAAAAPALARDEARLLPSGLHNYWTGGNPYKDRDPQIRDRIAAMYEFQIPLVRQLHEAGVPLLTGTDAPLPVMYPGGSLHDEIEELVGVGLSPIEALAAATRNAGAFVRQYVDEGARFGTVEPGARADLILLAGDPLADLDLLRRPLGVMLRGRWLDRGAIDALLDDLAAFAAER